MTVWMIWHLFKQKDKESHEMFSKRFGAFAHICTISVQVLMTKAMIGTLVEDPFDVFEITRVGNEPTVLVEVQSKQWFVLAQNTYTNTCTIKPSIDVRSHDTRITRIYLFKLYDIIVLELKAGACTFEIVDACGIVTGYTQIAIA